MSNSYFKNILYKTITKNKRLILLLILMIIGVVSTSLIPPQILKHMIDENLTLQKEKGLLSYAILYFIIIMLIGLFEFLKEAILTIFGQKISREIRSAMIKKLEKLNLGFFTTNSTGVTVSRFMNDVDAINSMFTNGIVGMLIDCLKIIGIVVSIWYFKAQLGIITLLIIPVIIVLTRYFQKRMLKAQIENRILVGKVNNHIGESIKNLITIKVFSKEAYMEEKYKGFLSDNYRAVEKVNFYDSVFSPIVLVVRASIIGLIVVLSSKQLNYLGISVGMVAASIDLISNLFDPIEQLGMELQDIQQAISGIRRVNDFFQETEDDSKENTLTAAQIISDKNNIVLKFNHVSFQYEEGAKILQDIDLQVRPLEKVAFVGRTGVGKSTLFKLILGLIKPINGSITLNGYNVYRIPNSEKRKIYGYVEQGFPLIHGTVASQISLNDEAISRKQIEEALEFVGMLDYIKTLEDGLDTMVKESMFSQGQKQLLSIARAIVTDPPILLLDEITANLDSLTEDKIISVLQQAGNNRMILSISHRLSSIVANDVVVVLENGRIKNAESPQMLLKNDDWFRNQLEMEKLTWS